ncbi:MAG: transposase [Deltaproteobacteria bacterium]|nr:transposase [Deltaproteobacteria bacterium]
MEQSRKKYHWYVTNLTAPRALIYESYRLRWQAELCFKSMKSTLNFDRIPTLSQNAVLSLCLLTLCNFVMASIVRAEADKRQKNSSETKTISSIQRAALILRETAGSLYSLIRLGHRITAYKTEQIVRMLLPILRSAFDPNFKNRKTTAERLYHA